MFITKREDKIYGLLTQCEVKMAGYWLNSFFFVFMYRDGVKVRKPAKNEQCQYPAILTEQAWSIKDLLYGFQGNFSCGIQQVNVVPSGQDSSVFVTQVANHSTSCPLTKLAIQKILLIAIIISLEISAWINKLFS